MERNCKILLLTITLYLCTGDAYAQIQTLQDTLSSINPEFYKELQSQRARRQRSDKLYFYTAEKVKLLFTQSGVTQLLADTLSEASTLQLEYKNGNRSVRLPTEAYNSQIATLYTEGFTTIGRAKIMGKFFFDKEWDDSLANNLTGNLLLGEPFTHFATKAGKYERQNIRFEAGIGYRLFEGLYFSSLLNYNYHWSTGSVDPRPDNKIFHLAYAPGLSYKIGNTAFGAEYKLGKTDGSFDIAFKNSMYEKSQLYPERQLWLNTGYGYIGRYDKETFSQSKDKIDGWAVNVATSLIGWSIKLRYSNEFSARKNFNLLSNTSNKENPIKEAIHSRYELTTQKSDILLYKEGEDYGHLLGFNGVINEGTAILLPASGPATGANYLFDEHNALLYYLFSLKQEHSVTAELGLNTGINHFTKKDFLATHFYENTKADFSVYAAKYIYGNKHTFKITARPGLAIPFENELTIPETQVNVFTRNIAYPEYDFLGSAFFSGKLGLVYYSPSLLRLAGSSISLNIDYLQKLKDSDIDRALLPMNTGKNQFNVSLGFQIFL